MFASIQLPAAESDSLMVLSDSMYEEGGWIVNIGAGSTWRFSPGDDIRWAEPEFDHSNWVEQSPSGLTEPLPGPLWDEGYGWFRTYFLADTSIYHKPWYFYFYTWGAAEVYIDGELAQSYGQFSTNPEDEVRYNPSDKLFPAFNLAPRDTHLIAVRLSYHPAQTYQNLLRDNSANFGFGVGLVKQDRNELLMEATGISKRVSFTAIGILFIITLLHGYLFYLFRDQKANLFIAIITGLLMLHSIAAFDSIHFPWLDRFWAFALGEYSFSTFFIGAVLLLPYTIVLLFNLEKYKKVKHMVWLVIPAFLSHIIYYNSIGISIITVGVLVLISSVFLLYEARKRNKKGIGFVSFGFLGILFVAATIIIYQGTSDNVEWAVEGLLILLLYIIIPMSMTLLMAFKMAGLYTGLEEIVESRTLELKNSLSELRAAQDKLVQQEKLASLGQLTAGIAHEIKNPLNFVNNFSEVSIELVEEARDEVNKETEDGRQKTEILEILDDIEANLKTIHRHGSRADSIVKSMLEHSRGGSGKLQPADLNGLIKEYINLSFHGMRAGQNPINVDINLDLDDSIGEVPLIAEDFSRVLLNLSNNAFDAMREKLNREAASKTSTAYLPRLSVRTSSAQGKILIEIEDNGPGIPDELKNKILQPFLPLKKVQQVPGWD